MLIIFKSLLDFHICVHHKRAPADCRLSNGFSVNHQKPGVRASGYWWYDSRTAPGNVDWPSGGGTHRTGADAVPVTWMGVLSEWQRDWTREATVAALAEIVLAHGGSTGTSLAWELQLPTSAGQKH
jgi:hypothetical protein